MLDTWIHQVYFLSFLLDTMKIILSTFLFLLVLVGWQDPTSNRNLPDSLIYSTDKTSYTVLDSFSVVLKNKYNYDILFGFGCKNYLVMFYQKKVNNVWSETCGFGGCCLNIWRYWMLNTDSHQRHLIQSVLEYYNPNEKIMIKKFSNTFTI